jgi:hypothetical protein
VLTTFKVLFQDLRRRTQETEKALSLTIGLRVEIEKGPCRMQTRDANHYLLLLLLLWVMMVTVLNLLDGYFNLLKLEARKTHQKEKMVLDWSYTP